MNLLGAMSMVLNQREISMSQTGFGGIEDIISNLDAWFIPNKIWGLKSTISDVLGVSKSIFTSSHAPSNTYMSLETAFNTKRRSVRTRSPSSSATTRIITLTSTLMSNIA